MPETPEIPKTDELRSRVEDIRPLSDDELVVSLAHQLAMTIARSGLDPLDPGAMRLNALAAVVMGRLAGMNSDNVAAVHLGGLLDRARRLREAGPAGYAVGGEALREIGRAAMPDTSRAEPLFRTSGAARFAHNRQHEAKGSPEKVQTFDAGPYRVDEHLIPGGRITPNPPTDLATVLELIREAGLTCGVQVYGDETYHQMIAWVGDIEKILAPQLGGQLRPTRTPPTMLYSERGPDAAAKIAAHLLTEYEAAMRRRGELA